MIIEVTNKQMIESAKLIKEGCRERKCAGGCPFFNLDGCGDCSLVDDGMPNSWFIPSLNPKLSDVEKVILGNLTSNYKWITRDEAGNVNVHCVLPQKECYFWNSDQSCFEDVGVLFPDLFAWCKWEDEEPWYIPDLLKGE